ncbi:MAG: YdcH family protein [Myxococcota bacterium]
MSKHQARTLPAEQTVSHLEKKHAQLAERVADLDGRRSLTPGEELELHQLKKEKLWTKDALQDAMQ